MESANRRLQAIGSHLINSNFTPSSLNNNYTSGEVANKVIVVGGGLAGLSACHTVLERGGRVLLIDKNPFLGGNSTKATSGINGALTTSQMQLGIPDSPMTFEKDTALSATKGKSDKIHPLGRVLVWESGPAVEWLKSSFNLDLSKVSRLGGHSQPRTHRGAERFPGMTITMALMEKLEKIAEQTPEEAQIILKAKVTKLIQDNNGNVVGVTYVEKDGKSHNSYGPVVIATGGYAADFEEDGLLKKYRPQWLNLPTTNGEHCTGDGIKMLQEIGGGTVDLDAVQVHPTGLVHPDDPDAKVKWLAAEALRGVGGLILDKNGHRFCNDLGTRDYVTGRMWDHNKPPYRLILNSAASKSIEWHCKHYEGRGLMKRYASGAELAKDMGITVNQLDLSFKEYNEIAKSGKDPWGKKYFDAVPYSINDSFYVAWICPVLHYTMGGIKIDVDGGALKDDGSKINGVYGAGEVNGGIHGLNRLGGSSLLDCVVFGRVAGASAAKYLFSQTLRNSTFSGSPASAPKQQQVTPKKTEVATPTKEYTLDEVAKHKTKDDCWVAVNGEVLEVTKFLPDHPGGAKAILLYAGKDASEEFNMLHEHSVIKKYAPYTLIGKLKK